MSARVIGTDATRSRPCAGEAEVLVRLLRTAFAHRAAPIVVVPTPAHERLMQSIVAAAESSRQDDLASLLDALDRTQPKCAAAHRHVGSHLGRLGLLRFARVQLDAALAIDPDHADAWIDLGNVHRLEGRNEDAHACYHRALIIVPDAEDAQLGVAACEIAAGSFDAAIERLQRLVWRSASAASVRMLVESLDRMQRHDEAKDVCIGILERDPDHGVAQAALGFLRLKRDLRPDEALVCFDRALATGLRDASLWSNRGIALQDLGRLAEAVESYDEALALEPGHKLARFHRSLARLMRSEFSSAWDDYELRLASTDRQPPPCELPGWDGQPSQDEILVYGEQGIGDEIMFASCVPDLLRICPRVTIVCNRKLEPVFRRSFPAARVLDVAQAKALAADGNTHWQQMVAIGSLPGYFRRDRGAFPRHAGYLRADPALVAEYRRRLDELGPGLKIGLSWRGGTDKTRRALRSVELTQLSTLFALPGVRFVNLQYDSRSTDDDLLPLVASGVVVDWRDALEDYERTAALIASLDVVVSVCTAAIHLAGALGRPTLIMAPYSPEWRYGIEGSDMPWYPSVHIERQRLPGEWSDVIASVSERILSRRAESQPSGSVGRNGGQVSCS